MDLCVEKVVFYIVIVLSNVIKQKYDIIFIENEKVTFTVLISGERSAVVQLRSRPPLRWWTINVIGLNFYSLICQFMM